MAPVEPAERLHDALDALTLGATEDEEISGLEMAGTVTDEATAFERIASPACDQWYESFQTRSWPAPPWPSSPW